MDDPFLDQSENSGAGASENDGGQPQVAVEDQGVAVSQSEVVDQAAFNHNGIDQGQVQPSFHHDNIDAHQPVQATGNHGDVAAQVAPSSDANALNEIAPHAYDWASHWRSQHVNIYASRAEAAAQVAPLSDALNGIAPHAYDWGDHWRRQHMSIDSSQGEPAAASQATVDHADAQGQAPDATDMNNDTTSPQGPRPGFGSFQDRVEGEVRHRHVVNGIEPPENLYAGIIRSASQPQASSDDRDKDDNDGSSSMHQNQLEQLQPQPQGNISSQNVGFGGLNFQNPRNVVGQQQQQQQQQHPLYFNHAFSMNNNMGMGMPMGMGYNPFGFAPGLPAQQQQQQFQQFQQHQQHQQQQFPRQPIQGGPQPHIVQSQQQPCQYTPTPSPFPHPIRIFPFLFRIFPRCELFPKPTRNIPFCEESSGPC